MDRETALRLAPIFRAISMILITLTFITWALPYFNYDADKDLGIDISKGPLRFAAIDGAYYDAEKGEFVGEFKVVSNVYRGEVLRTLDGKNDIKDYPDEYSLWSYILFTYKYPQILAKINYDSAKPESAKYHSRFYDSNNNPIPWKDIKIADLDHADVSTNPRFIKMWFIGVTLYQILIGVVALLMCWKKRGIMTQFFPVLFGVIGVVGYLTNRVLLYYSYPATYWVQFAMCCLVLINGIIGVVVQALEIKSRPEGYYLPMV